jgi:hypothetical protein
MLTAIQYNNLWTLPAPNGFGLPAATIPDYNYYVIREHMFEDYLDIFRGMDTRAARLAAFPVAGMPYPANPFTPYINAIANGEKTKPCIKYILIAEAAPPLNPRVLTAAVLDPNNSYFYSTIDIKSTGYFSAPVTAFGIAGVNKLDKLVQLALAGVILVDIFPFATSYNSIRKDLINYGTLNEFFYGVMGTPESLIARIGALSIFFCNTESFPTATFIAPPKISHHLADNMRLGLIPQIPGVNIKLNLNQFGPNGGLLIPGIALTPLYFIWPVGDFLNGVYYNINGLNRTPYIRCCSYSGAGMPHEIFIRNALF